MHGKEWSIPKEKWNRRDILLVFARAPEPGKVKTRLAKDLGPKKALDLYRCFVSEVLTAARAWAKNRQTGTSQREIWISYTPADRETMVRNWLGRDYTYLAQTGEGLGMRMASAMAAAFESGGGKVLLVGTDIPDLAASHLEAACSALDHTSLVWGPSLDGGYWLAGASKPGDIQSVFQEIPWGTSRVLARTLDRCREAQLTWTLLDPLQDVDTAADLEITAFHKRFKTL